MKTLLIYEFPSFTLFVRKAVVQLNIPIHGKLQTFSHAFIIQTQPSTQKSSSRSSKVKRRRASLSTPRRFAFALARAQRGADRSRNHQPRHSEANLLHKSDF